MVTQVEVSDVIRIYGTKPLKLERPGQYVQVNICNITTGVTIAATKSDSDGYFYLEISKTNFTYGTYQVRFYGYGMLSGELPDGDWEVIRIIDPDIESSISNVDNTSDLNKSISTATQLALNAKITITADGDETFPSAPNVGDEYIDHVNRIVSKYVSDGDGWKTMLTY